ncbi:hypothetical protein DFH27DRAFT_367002 [Peziza echinospora]|nr:hypothetical protein DFH27DRAFT_367002 [Peziza echinospora]
MHKHSSSFRRAPSPAPPPTPRLRSAPMKLFSSDTASSSTAYAQLSGTDPIEKGPPEEAGEEATLLQPSSKYRRKRKVLEDGKPEKGLLRMAMALGKIVAWILGIALFLWCGATIVGWIISLPGTTTESNPESGKKVEGAVEGSSQDPVMVIEPPRPLSPPVETNSHSTSPTSHGHGEAAVAAVYNYDDYSNDPTPRAVFVPPENPTHWTLHLPRTGVDYPLGAEAYQGLCASANSASSNMSESLHGGGSGHGSHRGYYTTDPTFLSPTTDLPSTTCPRTLTYLLSHLSFGKHPHSSIGATLMGVWLAYGLAQRENRTFILDDTNWEWGTWTDYFLPLPSSAPLSTSCSPPPYYARLPCPHNTPHLLLTPLTHSAETFGHNFVDEFEDAHAREVMRQVNIFDLAHEGYKALFHLTPTLTTLSSGRKSLLLDAAEQEYSSTGWRRERDGFIALHVRHGDAHPSEFWYHKGYLPSERYVDVARDMMVINETSELELPVLMISDDPGVFSDDILDGSWRVQDDFEIPFVPQVEDKDLEKRSGLIELTHPTEVFAKYLPGFPPTEDFSPVTYPGHKRKEMVNGYLMDLKISGELAREGDDDNGVVGGVVCGGYSYTCRLLAVIMGWEQAIVKERWRDVDGWVWVEGNQEDSDGDGGSGRGLRKGNGGQWRGWVW